MGIPVERGPPAPASSGTSNRRRNPPSRDFRITSAHRIGHGSLREKTLDNIKAIYALKKIEAENRDATQAEQAVLARYTGWGAMANAFRPYRPGNGNQSPAN
jgi:hypothetical protein